MRAIDFISEALRPSQYRQYMRPYWTGKRGTWDKQRYSEIFGDKYRIYFPLEGHTPTEIEPNKYVVDALQSLGYTVTPKDYVTGYATKNNRKYKIGRILTNEYSENEDMVDKLVKLFVNDPARAVSSSDTLVVISRHPYDIAGMSTDRGWTSCMNISAGSMSNYVMADVKHGTLVAYLIKSNDKDIKNPIARVLIKPFVNKRNPNNVIFGVENRVYGTAPPSFAQTVSKWANAINSSKVLTGLYEIPDEVYRDDIKSHQWYGSEDEAEQIEAVEFDTKYLNTIPNPSAAVVRAALRRDAHAIQYVKNPTQEQVEWALRADGTTLQYIKNPTEQQIITAVNSTPLAIKYVQNPNERIQLLAVSKGVAAVKHIPNLTDRAKRLAVLLYPRAIEYIRNPSEELQLFAVKHGDDAILQNIVVGLGINPSKRVIYAALKKYPTAIRYVQNPSRAMQAYAIKQDPYSIRYIYKPSEAIQLLAVRRAGRVIGVLDYPSERVQLAAIANSKHAYEMTYERDRTPATYEFFKRRWPKYYRELRKDGWTEFPDWVNVETELIRKGRVYEEQ